jgi:hypothetical protein
MTDLEASFKSLKKTSVPLQQKYHLFILFLGNADSAYNFFMLLPTAIKIFLECRRQR